MFQNHWATVQKLQEIHQQDLMREAQQMHIYRLAVSAQPPANPLTWRFFSWLGLQMVSLGSHMHQHYTRLAELPSDLQANLSPDEPCGC